MMMNDLKKILLILTCFWLPSAWAVSIPDLYQGSVPVANQSQTTFKAALPRALAQVLVKVSGHINIATDPQVKPLLKRASSLLLSYRYAEQARAEGQSQLLLIAQFEPRAVIKGLQAAQQPVWGDNRPLVIVWAAIQDRHGWTLLTSDSDNSLKTTLTTSAKQRGLALAFPIGDMIDFNHISAEDVADGDIDRAEAASKRYQADAILLATIKSTGAQRWQTQWQLLGPLQAQTTLTATTATQAVANGVNWLTESLAQRYAVSAKQAQAKIIIVHINNISGLDDYATAVKYLKSLTPVRAVETIDLKEGSMALKLIVLGGEQSLLRAISAEKILRPQQTDVLPAPGQPQTLYLHYR